MKGVREIVREEIKKIFNEQEDHITDFPEADRRVMITVDKNKLDDITSDLLKVYLWPDEIKTDDLRYLSAKEKEEAELYFNDYRVGHNAWEYLKDQGYKTIFDDNL